MCCFMLYLFVLAQSEHLGMKQVMRRGIKQRKLDSSNIVIDPFGHVDESRWTSRHAMILTRNDYCTDLCGRTAAEDATDISSSIWCGKFTSSALCEQHYATRINAAGSNANSRQKCYWTGSQCKMDISGSCPAGEPLCLDCSSASVTCPAGRIKVVDTNAPAGATCSIGCNPEKCCQKAFPPEQDCPEVTGMPCPGLTGWHSSRVLRAADVQMMCVAKVIPVQWGNWAGVSCTEWCAESGYDCLRAQDDHAGTCALHPGVYTTLENECQQKFMQMMCQCGKYMT